MPKRKSAPPTIPLTLRDALVKHIEEAWLATIDSAWKNLIVGYLARHAKMLLPHGEFGPWIKAEMFAGAGEKEFQSRWRAVQRAQQLSHAVDEALKTEKQKRHNVVFLKIITPLWKWPELEYVQAAVRVLTRELWEDKEMLNMWEAWGAAVTHLLHEHTEKDLVLELRSGLDKWHVHTPPNKPPEVLAQMEFEELRAGWMDMTRAVVIHGKNWVQMPREELVEFVCTVAPVLAGVAESANLSRKDCELLIGKFVNINNALRARLEK